MSPRPAPRWTLLCALAVLCVAAVAHAAAPSQVVDARLWSGPEGTRLVLDLSASARYQVFTLDSPDRVVVDLENTRLTTGKALPGGQGPVRSVRSGPQAGGGLRIVLDLESRQVVKSFMVAPEGAAGHRLVVELPPVVVAAPVATPPAAPPLAAVAHRRRRNTRRRCDNLGPRFDPFVAPTR